MFGALDREGRIDLPRMQLVRELSKGLILTFHRAFDMCSDPQDIAMEQIISLGCDRLLTSGGPDSSVLRNMDELKAIAAQAGSRIIVVAAAGITPDNVQAVIRGSGVRAVHAGSSVTVKTTVHRGSALDGGVNNRYGSGNDSVSGSGDGSGTVQAASVTAAAAERDSHTTMDPKSFQHAARAVRQDSFGESSFVNVAVGGKMKGAPAIGRVNNVCFEGAVGLEATEQYREVGCFSSRSTESKVQCLDELSSWDCVDQEQVAKLVHLANNLKEEHGKLFTSDSPTLLDSAYVHI